MFWEFIYFAVDAPNNFTCPYFSAQVSLLLQQLTQETVSLKNHTTNKIPSLPTKMKTNNTTTTTTTATTPANKQIVMVVKTTMQTQNKLKEQKQPSNELLKFQLQLIGPQKLLATKNEANNTTTTKTETTSTTVTTTIPTTENGVAKKLCIIKKFVMSECKIGSLLLLSFSRCEGHLLPGR